MSDTEQQIVPYEGSEPYIFISYSHSNSGKILPVVRRLTENGYRVWYDEGIEGGDKWDAEIQKHVKRCAFLFAFLSENYQKSDWCITEIALASDYKKKIVGIFIEDFEFDDEVPLEVYVKTTQNLFMHKSSTEDFYRKVFSIKGLDKCLDRSKVEAKNETARKCREHMTKLHFFDKALDSFSPEELIKAYHDTSQAMFFFEQEGLTKELEYAQSLYARINERINANMTGGGLVSVGEENADNDDDVISWRDAPPPEDEKQNGRPYPYPWSDIKLPENEEQNGRPYSYPWSDIKLHEGEEKAPDFDLSELEKMAKAIEADASGQSSVTQAPQNKEPLDEVEYQRLRDKERYEAVKKEKKYRRVRIFSAITSTAMYAFYILFLLNRGSEGYPKGSIFLIVMAAAILNDIGTFALEGLGKFGSGIVNIIKHHLLSISTPIVICTFMYGAGFSILGSILLPVLASALGFVLALIIDFLICMRDL